MEISTTMQDQFANALDTAVGSTGFVRFFTAAYAATIASAACNSPAFGAAATGAITLDVGTAVQDTSPATAGTVDLMGIYADSTTAAANFIMAFGVEKKWNYTL